jgi:hypothetical protein
VVRVSRGILAAALLVSAGAFAADPPEDARVGEARALYARGIELVKASEWAEALDNFEKSFAARAHPVTLYNIGACERAMGRYTRAAAHLRDAVEARSTDRLPGPMEADARAFIDEIDRILVRVTVTLDPADAAVSVDGRPLLDRGGTLVAGLRAPGPGEPPPSATFELVLDPGTRLLTLSRKGFSDVVLTRTFAPATRGPLPLTLHRLPATLRIAADVERAIVRIDGADVGMAPVEVSRPGGSYRVIVSKDGREPYEAQIRVNPGEESQISATLVEKKTPLTKRWWFWAAAGAVVVGGALTTYALTRPEPQPPAYDGGTTGWIARP